MIPITLHGVREYAEGMDVQLREENGRLVVHALNEAGHNCTMVDLLELTAWLKANRPELLNGELKAAQKPPVQIRKS